MLTGSTSDVNFYIPHTDFINSTGLSQGEPVIILYVNKSTEINTLLFLIVLNLQIAYYLTRQLRQAHQTTGKRRASASQHWDFPKPGYVAIGEEQRHKAAAHRAQNWRKEAQIIISKASLKRNQTEFLFCFWPSGNFAMEKLDRFFFLGSVIRDVAVFPSQLSPVFPSPLFSSFSQSTFLSKIWITLSAGYCSS